MEIGEIFSNTNVLTITCMHAFSEEMNLTSGLSHYSVQMKSTNIMILLTRLYPFMRKSNHISQTRDYSSLLNICLVVHFAQIAKELKITPILDKLLEYRRSWIQHVNRMPRMRSPTVMKYYSPTGRRSQGRPLKRLLDT